MPKKTFEYAEQAGITFLTQVKNNQKTLLHQIKHGCHVYPHTNHVMDTWEKHHGRLERRTYETFSPHPMLDKWQDEWGCIRQVIRVTRYRERLKSKNKPSCEVHYYVCNRLLSIDQIRLGIRQHWGIENHLHYVKDVAFQEDIQPRRVRPELFSTFIDMALNKMRAFNIDNIKGALYENSINLMKTMEKYNLIHNISTP